MSAIAIEVESILPKELAWLVTSYIDVPERCPACFELWQFRAVRECSLCQRICHWVECTTETQGAILCTKCTSEINPCVKCREPVTWQDGGRCNGCDMWYHRTCRQLSQSHYCSFCIKQQYICCAFCTKQVHIYEAGKARCDKCCRVACPSHKTSRQFCNQCKAKCEARELILREKLFTKGIRDCQHFFLDQYACGIRDDLELVTHAICQNEFLKTFCQMSSFDSKVHHETIQTAFLALVPKEEPWPWQQGITPEAFRAMPAFEKAVEYIKKIT